MVHPFVSDLREVIDSDAAYEFLPHGDWLAGGCGLLAEALQRHIPDSELMVIGRLDDGLPDHLLIRVPVDDDWVYVDGDGIHYEQELLSSWREAMPGRVISMVPAEDYAFDPDDPDALFWYKDSVPAFARFLKQELGLIDAQRLDPAWLDESDRLAPIATL